MYYIYIHIYTYILYIYIFPHIYFPIASVNSRSMVEGTQLARMGSGDLVCPSLKIEKNACH